MRRRALLAIIATLAVGVVGGCLDAIAPGHGGRRAASFGLVPVFEGDSSGGVPGDVDLIRITLHDPPSPDTTIDRPVTPGQDSMSITIPIALNGPLDSVIVTFQAIRSSDGRVLYSGTDTIPVAPGLPTAAAPIVAVYVGPGRSLLSIAIIPSAVTLRPGDTVTFGFLALDSSKTKIDSMPALFASRDPSRATVSASGLARAVSIGATYVVVTSGARTSVKDSALVTVSATLPAPAIALTPTSVPFAATVGGASPASQTVAVTNGGTGTLDGLAVGTITYGAGASGWLAASVSPGTAPATVTLTATLGSLVAGTYTATVPMTSTATGVTNSPQSISVTFTVSPAPAPVIVLAPTSVPFTATVGAASPAAQTVAVTNGGTGTLSGLGVGTITYGAGASGWLAASVSPGTAPATVTLTATLGSLAAGTYTATVPVTSTATGVTNSPQTISVTFTVSPPAPVIVLAPTTVPFTATAGGSSPAAQTVAVTNGGTGTLSGLGVGTITYGAGASGWLAASVSPGTAPATVTLTATLGSLAAGTYTATVPVTSTATGVTNSPQTIAVTFTVTQAPVIVLAPTSVPFTATVGGSSPAAQTVAVTNGGTGTLNGLGVGTITYGAGASGWLAASVSPGTAPATVTLTATLGSLAVGTYTATVPVTSTATGVTNSPQTIAVTFTVTQVPVIVLTPTSRTFTATVGGASPAAQTVAVTNGGTGTLSGLGVGTITYGAGASGWLAASVSPGTAPATVTLTATLGSLAVGTYTATVPVTSTATGVTNSPQSISVTFQVVGSPLASMTVTPGYRVMLLGDVVTMQVVGRDSLGNPVGTPGLAFASRTPAVATVAVASGNVTAVASGSAVIEAQAPGVGGTVGDSSLVVVPATGSAVVAALGGGRYFGAMRLGDTVTVQVVVDLRAVSSEVLGSYNAQLNWNPAALQYVSSAAVAGGFAAPTVNETQTSTGQLRFTSADPNGSAGTVALIAVKFVGTAAGTSPLTLALTDLSAAATFTNLLPAAVVVSGSVTVH